MPSYPKAHLALARAELNARPGRHARRAARIPVLPDYLKPTPEMLRITPSYKGMTRGQLESMGIGVQDEFGGKRVPEDVGCTVSTLDYVPVLRMKATMKSAANAGEKLQHANLGDGTLRSHKRSGRG